MNVYLSLNLRNIFSDIENEGVIMAYSIYRRIRRRWDFRSRPTYVRTRHLPGRKSKLRDGRARKSTRFE